MLGLIFAMAGPATQAGAGKGSWFSTLIPLVVIFAIFYFLMIRPQQKQQKKHKEMISAMRKGDKVITRGGIHGTVYGIADNVLTLEVAENVKIKINREAVALVQANNA
ncbi:MAG: preprotein translocase subunit YajC [Pseudomonadota bacterium]